MTFKSLKAKGRLPAAGLLRPSETFLGFPEEKVWKN